MNQDELFDRAPLADLWESPQGLPAPPQPSEPPPPAAFCLKCGKVAKVLTPGRAAVFCSKACKTAWIGGMNKWGKRYARECDRLDRAGVSETTLF